jgi:hypothetical protein
MVRSEKRPGRILTIGETCRGLVVNSRRATEQARLPGTNRVLPAAPGVRNVWMRVTSFFLSLINAKF